MPVTPLSAALGELIVELRLVEGRWPSELERRSLLRARTEVHRDVTVLLLLLHGAPPTSIGRSASVAAHEAFVAALVLAVLVQRMVRRSRKRPPELPPTACLEAAAARLLDVLDPYVQRADVALRRVMLDGERMELVSEQIALPA